MKKVFLGGTTPGGNWRETIKELLEIPYFDPTVEDWDEEALRVERAEKDSSDIHLYTITKEMSGVYSIAEVVDAAWRSSLNKKSEFKHRGPYHVAFCVVPEGFSEGQMRSLRAVGKLVEDRGGNYFESLYEAAIYLNSFA